MSRVSTRTAAQAASGTLEVLGREPGGRRSARGCRAVGGRRARRAAGFGMTESRTIVRDQASARAAGARCRDRRAARTHDVYLRTAAHERRAADRGPRRSAGSDGRGRQRGSGEIVARRACAALEKGRSEAPPAMSSRRSPSAHAAIRRPRQWNPHIADRP